jgi:lipopolysaccharide/colanic/teichoic acid biosynthesis glycosyltransferase
VALVLLLLLSPLLLALAVLMGLDMLAVRRDRGGWLYREPRLSRGRAFDLLKLRTLRAEAMAELTHRGGYAGEYESDEGNLTWMGRRVLKPWYLDELPQLWNVLRGHLSLVGPRPWPPAMVREQRAQGLDYRDRVQAGWTGPAQINKGVPGVRFSDQDLAYVEACRTWSVWRLLRFDLWILGQTLRVLLRGEGLRF